jgi:hypothetical protein
MHVSKEILSLHSPQMSTPYTHMHTGAHTHMCMPVYTGAMHMHAYTHVLPSKSRDTVRQADDGFSGRS